MKNILVPTDYSSHAKNAAEYAMELAGYAKSNVIMFHAYHVPVPSPDHALPQTGLEMAQDNIRKLKNYAAAIHSQHEEVAVDYEVKAGFAVDQILNSIKERNIDLVIIGTRGRGSLGDEIVGSVVTKICAKSPVPVLVVPEKVSFVQIKRIALAYDYSEISNLEVLQILKTLVTVFKAEALIVNVLKTAKSILSKTGSSDNLESFLADIKHSFHFPVNKDIVGGINNFIDENKIDLVAVIPHKHSLMHRIFIKSNVKRIALHPHIPLLVLPG